jgi:hypothetical protein
MQFSEPTKNDIVRSKVVVTTLVTSLILSELGVKGHFTHIFVDEAAQVCLTDSFFVRGYQVCRLLCCHRTRSSSHWINVRFSFL